MTLDVVFNQSTMLTFTSPFLLDTKEKVTWAPVSVQSASCLLLLTISQDSQQSLSAVNLMLCKLSKESCKSSYFVVIKVNRTLGLT